MAIEDDLGERLQNKVQGLVERTIKERSERLSDIYTTHNLLKDIMTLSHGWESLEALFSVAAISNGTGSSKLVIPHPDSASAPRRAKRYNHLILHFTMGNPELSLTAKSDFTDDELYRLMPYFRTEKLGFFESKSPFRQRVGSERWPKLKEPLYSRDNRVLVRVAISKIMLPDETFYSFFTPDIITNGILEQIGGNTIIAGGPSFFI
ncbi:MAG: hypothetical protein ACMG6E_02440 [Candidatus Roizmanbacteria bacterium]